MAWCLVDRWVAETVCKLAEWMDKVMAVLMVGSLAVWMVELKACSKVAMLVRLWVDLKVGWKVVWKV